MSHASLLLKEFDESKVLRDERGRFADSAGGSAISSGIHAPEEKGSATHTQKTRVRRVLDKAKELWGSAKPILGQMLLGVSVGLASAVVLEGINRASGHFENKNKNKNKEWPNDDAWWEDLKRNGREYQRAHYEQTYGRSRGGSRERGESQRARAQTQESQEQAEFRAKNGAKAAAILTLYLRAGTVGEKAAAAAALGRMGIDISSFSKMLLKATKAEMKAMFAVLDPLITEDEAQSILDALVDNLSFVSAEKMLRNASNLHPEMSKAFDMESSVETWSSLVNDRVDLDALASRWLDISKGLVKANPYHDEMGRFTFAHGGGGSGNTISGSEGQYGAGRAFGAGSSPGSRPPSMRRWSSISNDSDGRTREAVIEHWEGVMLNRSQDSSLTPDENKAAGTKAEKWETWQEEMMDETLTAADRAEARRKLLQSVGQVHDNELDKIAAEEKKRLEEAQQPKGPKTLEQMADEILRGDAQQQQNQPGRGAGDNFTAAQNAQRARDEEAARIQRERQQKQQGGTGYTQEDQDAVNREVARVKAARESSDFEARFERATAGVSSDSDRSILSSLGNTLGHAARSTYYAQELVRGLAGGIASASSGNYLEVGRALMEARSDFASLRANVGGMTEEGARVVTRSIDGLSRAIPKIKSVFTSSGKKSE